MLDQRHDRGLEVGPTRQQPRIAAGFMSEPEVLAYAHLTRPQGPSQHVPAELLGLEAGEFGGERNQDQLIDSERSDEVGFYADRCQQLWWIIGPQDLKWMGIERYDGDPRVVCLPPLDRSSNHLPVTAMNAVESADR
jgi:hypothetical protein